MMALAELLGEVSLETFFADHFPDRHLVTHGSLDRLPAMFYSGVLADPRDLSAAYRGPVYVTNRGLGRHIMYGVEAHECFGDLGLTVGFPNAETLVPGAAGWLRTLEAELGAPRGCASLSVFVNGPGSGLSAHCDLQEQIVVQLAGTKTFRLQAPPARFPRMKHEPGHAARPSMLAQSDSLLEASSLPDSAERAVLRPGSVLFMPRGMYHETLAGDETAMTAVVAFCQPSPAELVTKYLENVLLQSEDWRRPLFAWSADRHDAASARMSALLVQLAARIQNLSVARVLASAETGLHALTDETRLQRDPSTQVVLRGHDPVRVEILLALGTGDAVTCTLPGALRPMLAWLAEGRAAFTFAEACARFADWDRSAVTAAVTALVRAKALVEIPFEAW